jgi:hypothetical protein
MTEAIADIPRPNEKGSGENSPLAIAFAMGEVKGTVENLRTDLKQFKDDIREDLTHRDQRVDEALEKHDARISALEKKVWQWSGIATLIGTLAGWAFEYVRAHGLPF